MKITALTIVATIFASLATVGTASAELCQDLMGTWVGTASGAWRGPVIIIFGSGCSYSGGLAATAQVTGSISKSGGKLLYSTSTGTKGIVTKSGNRLTFRNVYTAQKQGAWTVRVTKR